MEEITHEITAKIKELEKDRAIEVLFACESGSRAWGFPSIDSDYDVRFIYRHPIKWYLTIKDKADVVELPVNSLLDINGWDLKKSLKLLVKHNSALYEWVRSPIVYAENSSFKNAFIDISNKCFSPIAGMHHYLSSSRKYYEKCIGSDKVKLKTYFYCLRSALASLWISDHRTVPPMELCKLLPLINHKTELLHRITVLQQLKAAHSESYLHPREPELDSFLFQTITLCQSVALSLPSVRVDEEALNTFFQQMVEG